MRPLLLLVVFCLFGVFTGISQENKMTMTEKEFHEIMDEISSIQTSNKDSVLVLIENMMKMAHTFNDEQISAKALITKSVAESKNVNQDQAIETIREA